MNSKIMVSYSPAAERIFLYITDENNKIHVVKITLDDVAKLKNMLFQCQFEAIVTQSEKTGGKANAYDVE
jgi:hypothetical protein